MTHSILKDKQRKKMASNGVNENAVNHIFALKDHTDYWIENELEEDRTGDS